MTVVTRMAVAALVGCVTAAVGYSMAAGEGAGVALLGPEPVTVMIRIEHSSFEPSSLRVAEGTTVRFVVVNSDPINHELIVGPQAVHDRHRNGTEGSHPPVPGEVSVGPGARAVTTYSFTRSGMIEMACHLPGHYDFGMHGGIDVVDGEVL